MGKLHYRHIESTTPLGNVSKGSKLDSRSQTAAKATEKGKLQQKSI